MPLPFYTEERTPLEGIKGQPGNEPNISDINSYYPDGLPLKQTARPVNPFTGTSQDLTDTVTSPGAGNPEDYDPVAYSQYGNINKGSYSGSIVGNIPIFVDSQIISFAPERARQQALQIAAAGKAKEIKSLEADLYKTPQLKNAPDQPEMNDVYLNGVEKWKQMYGGDVPKMMQDPQFRKWQEDVKTAGKINDAAFDNYAVMAKEMDEGKKYFSQETRENQKSFFGGLANLGDPANPQAQNFTSKAFRLNQSYDLDMAINDVISKYKAPVNETAPEIKKQGIYDTIITKKQTNTNRADIDKLADDLWENKYAGTKTYTKEQVRKRMQEALPFSEENTVQTHANQFAPKADAAPKETYSLDQKEPVKQIMTVSRKGAGETSFNLSNVYKTNTADQAKQVTYTIPPGIKYTDGTPVSSDAGNVKGVISEIGVAQVYKKGLTMPVKKLSKNPAGQTKGVQTYEYVPTDIGGMVVGSVDVKPGTNFSDGMYENKPVAMFNVSETQEGEAGKDQPNRTMVLPLNSVVGHYAKPGKKPGELDLTDVAKDVEHAAKLAEVERHAKVAEYNRTKNPQTTGKKAEPQKKTVTSGGLKPTGDL